MQLLSYWIKKPAAWLLIAALFAGILFACQPKPAVEKGRFAPDFGLPDANQAIIHLSDLRGSVVLLNFWATWCEPCKEEMPSLQDLQDRYGALGFKVVVVSLGDTLKDASLYIQGKGYTFISLVDTQGVIEKTYNANTLPQSVLIDTNGRVVDTWTGPAEDLVFLASEVEGLLPKKAAFSTATPTLTAEPPDATLTLSPAPALTSTLTLTQTSTPSPTPLADTSTPQPTLDGYPAPRLVSPADGAAFDYGSYARLAWQWDGLLQADEYFDITFWPQGGEPVHLGRTKASFELFIGNPDTTYYWTVSVARLANGRLQPLSPAGVSRRVAWGPAPTPTRIPPTPLPAPTDGLTLACPEHEKEGPAGELAAFVVTLTNTGSRADTYEISMAPALPGGWQGSFCIGSECYTGGVHPIQVQAGGEGMIVIKIIPAPTAPAGQSGHITLNAASQADPDQRASVTVTLTVR